MEQANRQSNHGVFVATCTTGREDYGAETDMFSARGAVDPTYRSGAFRRLSAVMVPIPVRYHVSFPMVLVSQLQLFHLNWLQSVREQHSYVLSRYNSCLTETLLQS